MRDYPAIAIEYAEAVGDGSILAGKYTRLAAKRFLDDLGRPSSPEFPYRFDHTPAIKFCAFVERCCHIEGELAGERINLEPWQVFVICNVFGWLCTEHHPEDRAGFRRFRKVYIEVARGNGKSLLLSALCNAMLTIDNEGGAQVLTAATKLDQAKVIWDISKAMVESPKTAPLMRKLGVETNSKMISVRATHCRYKPVAAEHKKEDGKNVSFCAIDELHAHDQRGLWDVLVSGAGKRRNSLIWAITTAGYNLSGVCYEQRSYVARILEGVIQDNSWFGCIWTIDDDDDWQDPACYPKANPCWGVSVDRSYVLGQAREAISVPGRQAEFLTKHLNRWLSSSQSWADIKSWKECIDPSLNIEDFADQTCFMGLDLASKTDMAAKVLLFPTDDGYVAFPTYYLPEEAVMDGRNASYRGWHAEKRIVTTPGNVLDFDRIEKDILSDMATYDVKEIGIDPHEARQLVQRLMAEGAEIVEIGQTVMHLSEPTKELDALTRSGRFRYNCPILLWMASNVIVRADTNDNIKPNKARPEDKIDGIIATILALARAMIYEDGPSVYEKRGITVFGASPYTSI